MYLLLIFRTCILTDSQELQDRVIGQKFAYFSLFTHSEFRLIHKKYVRGEENPMCLFTIIGGMGENAHTNSQ